MLLICSPFNLRSIIAIPSLQSNLGVLFHCNVCLFIIFEVFFPTLILLVCQLRFPSVEQFDGSFGFLSSRVGVHLYPDIVPLLKGRKCAAIFFLPSWKTFPPASPCRFHRGPLHAEKAKAWTGGAENEGGGCRHTMLATLHCREVYSFFYFSPFSLFLSLLVARVPAAVCGRATCCSSESLHFPFLRVTGTGTQDNQAIFARQQSFNYYTIQRCHAYAQNTRRKMKSPHESNLPCVRSVHLVAHVVTVTFFLTALTFLLPERMFLPFTHECMTLYIFSL